jgi:hypothetical protein
MRRSRNMMRSTRGAARISAVWMIVMIVLFLVAIAFAFIAQSDMSAAQSQKEAAETAAQEATDSVEGYRDEVRGLSAALGWYDRDSSYDPSDLDAVVRAVEELRAVFTDLTAADADFQTIIPKIIAAYNQKNRELAELRARTQTLEGEVAAARQATTNIETDKNNTVAQLRQQIADEQQNAEQTTAELQQRLAAAQAQLSERDLELRQTRANAQQERRRLERELLAKDTRINELARLTRPLREPFNQYPDGRILATSTELNLAWIDLGANHRLTRGTRFRVESGRPGERYYKAMAEVVSVEANRAEVLLSDINDAMDPVAAGDVIINPLFDPSGGRNAILVGRFSGAYNENELRLLLGRMGINVQPDLDRTTHFLIVGSELWNDPETNEPLEEPLQPSELPLFKNAEAMGVQIIPLQDIREFFRVQKVASGA